MHDLQPTTRRLATLVERVDDSQLGAPTPCPDYSVGDLLDHIGRLAVAFTSAARKEDGTNASPPPPGDRANLGDDWRTRIPRDLVGLGDAWESPDAWEGATKIAGMEMPAGVVGTVGLNEVVTHGWDLARAHRSTVRCRSRRHRGLPRVHRTDLGARRRGQPGAGLRPCPHAPRRRVARRPVDRAHRPRSGLDALSIAFVRRSHRAVAEADSLTRGPRGSPRWSARRRRRR